MKKSGCIFEVDKKINSKEKLEEKIQADNIWNNQEEAKKLMQELSLCNAVIERVNKLKSNMEELGVFIELAEAENLEKSADIENLINEIENEFSEIENEKLFSGEFDNNNSILMIHSGAGGVDAQDWAEMLFRMYLRWAEKKGFSVQIVDVSSGDEAGIKSATLLVNGNKAYGLLKAEKGIHRLVRISPFDANHRRHTSFALVDATPEINEEIEIEINPDDLKVDTYRSSGAGGQHVNKTDSAIRITHIPTGIVVQCQNERSQHSNRNTAIKILKAKLYELKEKEQVEKISQLKGDHKEIAWGNQIRSYTMHPYTLVKDHRTNTENSNFQGVLDGDIDKFIWAYLKAGTITSG